MFKTFKIQHGFTVIEIISVLVVLGILTVVVVSRMANYNTEVAMGTDTLKAHLRYAQIMAMNKDPNVGTETIIGINYDSGANQYWLFGGTNPNSNILFLPDDSQYITKLANGDKINLAAKKIKIGSGFTIYFDHHGIPYTLYTDSATNTPLAGLLTISVTSLSGGSSNSVTISPLTGFIP